MPASEADWIPFLSVRHDADLPILTVRDAYYEGRQPLTYMHPEILREVADRIRPVVLFWPQLVVDSVDERLDVNRFRLPKQDAGDDDLWRVWQANDLDEESQMGRVDALVMKRSYLCVGANEDDADTALITVESPLEVFGYVDPRTRQVAAALKRTYLDETVVRSPERYATLYLPNVTIWYDWANGYREIDRDEHNLGVVPVVPLVNRPRTHNRYGRSELDSVIPLSDAANKLATDMMVAAEFVAIPLRGIFGVGPDDLEDQDGNKMTALQAIMGRLLTLPDAEGTAKMFEFASANLSNFHTSIEALAREAAAIGGLPPDYLGLATDNPPSAESRQAAEIRLIKRAERKQVAFGGSYEKTMRLVRRIQEGDWDPALKRLETDWRDASTPTVAQSGDAAVKKFQAGIVPKRQTREDLRYTDVQIERMEAEDEKAAAMDPIGQMTRAIGQGNDRMGMAGDQPVRDAG
jgi:hypothetical protein